MAVVGEWSDELQRKWGNDFLAWREAVDIAISILLCCGQRGRSVQAGKFVYA